MTTAATILLVEDDQSLLDGISDLLEVVNLGYDLSVLTASNGKEGLDIMADYLPDLVISDIMMPKMGGFEFLEHLRKNSAWIHIPVIFLSARGTREDIRAGRVSGAEVYITKPFDNNELLEMVKSQLDRTFELRFDRARRLDNIQRSIIQILNHEFRTPLTYVTAYYEMLEEGLPNQSIEYIQEYLRGIQVGAVRMTRLIDNFVKVIELRTGETVERYNEQARRIDNLADLFKGICQTWQSSSEMNVQFDYDIPDTLPPVYGGATFLEEILDRLIDNAVKFTTNKYSDAPAIHVSVGNKDGEVYAAVQDNGIGFPEHAKSQLFDLFYQHNREQMEQQGSGTGLTVVKGFVELHGGRIEVDSEVGEGSTFTVFFPIYSESSAASLPGQNQKSTPKKPATVLLVEDEMYLLAGLRELLEIFECNYNLRVLTASDGVEGLKVLENHKPDLIVTDIMMPRMGGYEFLSHVRENQTLVHIPVIFLTAKGERQDIIRGRTSGAEEYIVKPYDSDELLELVVKQLDRYFEMQGAIHQDFDELKRGILNLLRPDIRNPLTSVSDYSQRMSTYLEVAQTEEEMRDSLKGIQSASRSITRLVEDFIFLAEIRTGEARSSFELVSRPTNVSLILTEACDNCRVKAEQYGITIKRELDMFIPPTLVDFDKLKSSLQRLINMLIEYCNIYHRGDVVVSTSAEDDEVILTLEVKGVSFSNEKVEQIRSLLSQESVKRLGFSDHDPDLITIKGIVDLHDGQIWIENSPGQKTSFVILLPVHQSSPEFDQI
ncbi:MAG: response regulator [Candidatus Promineifilaceae bacterium]